MPAAAPWRRVGGNEVVAATPPRGRRGNGPSEDPTFERVVAINGREGREGWSSFSFTPW